MTWSFICEQIGFAARKGWVPGEDFTIPKNNRDSPTMRVIPSAARDPASCAKLGTHKKFMHWGGLGGPSLRSG